MASVSIRSLLPTEFVNDMLEKTLEIDQLRDYGSTDDPRDLTGQASNLEDGADGNSCH